MYGLRHKLIDGHKYSIYSDSTTKVAFAEWSELDYVTSDDSVHITVDLSDWDASSDFDEVPTNLGIIIRRAIQAKADFVYIYKRQGHKYN
jgi:DNA repair exonuclease SbcCD nuclease subunit